MYWTKCKTIIFYSIKYIYLSTTLKLIVDLHYLENYKNLLKQLANTILCVHFILLKRQSRWLPKFRQNAITRWQAILFYK